MLYDNTPESDETHPDHPDRKLCYGCGRKWTNIKAQLAFARLTAFTSIDFPPKPRLDLFVTPWASASAAI